VCDGFETVKAPAKKIAYTKSQSEINQRKHTQILCNLADNTGANPKRAISSVKHASKLFSTAGRTTGCPKIFATQNFGFCNSPVAPPFDSAHEFFAKSECR
jgi:hypothetical protein